MGTECGVWQYQDDCDLEVDSEHSFIPPDLQDCDTKTEFGGSRIRGGR